MWQDMVFDKDKHNRRSIRLAGYDYRTAGAYFVTICSHQKKCVFGRVRDGVMHMNAYGRIVAEEWARTSIVRPNFILDEWMVMPNHFHAIIILPGDYNVGASRRLAPIGAVSGSLGAIMAQFKSIVTKRINAYRAAHNMPPVIVWQRSFYERIIRDEKELDDTRRYIAENPLNWGSDVENTNA